MFPKEIKIGKEIKLSLIIFSVLIVGVVLIYLTAVQFFREVPPKEIVIELEEERVETEKMAEVKKIDYLAPDFELPNLEGEKVKLSDYRNKNIILNFWTTWNSAAKDQIVIFESYYQEIKDRKDLVLLAVNSQEHKSVVGGFIRRGQYTLPVLLDEDGRVGELYKIGTLPSTYFINPEGKVKEIYIGVLNKEEIKNKIERLYQE